MNNLDSLISYANALLSLGTAIDQGNGRGGPTDVIASALEIEADLILEMVAADDNITRTCNLLQCLLGCAVQSESREKHIAVIMALPQANQQCLAMEIDAILSKLNQVKSREKETSSANPPNAQSEPSGGTPLKAIGNELGPALKRSLRTNAALKQENESLHAENKDLQRRLEDLEKKQSLQQGGGMGAGVQKSLEDIKADFKERELDLLNALKEKESCVGDLKIRIDTLLKEVAQAKKLKDEMEVLRAQANAAAKANLALSKLRQKLDVATGYKKQLDVMQAKFEELLQKNLEADKQVKLIPNLKRDLESCKAALMQSELRYSELQLLNDEKEQMLKKMQEEWATVRESEMQATLENVALQKNLEAADDQAQDTGNVLGDGCTELNPHIREELERLQEENKALRAATSDQGADNLRELALSLENMTRLKDGLQDKLLSSKQENESLQKKLQSSQEQVSSLNVSTQQMDEEIKEHLGKIGVLTGRLARCEEELAECLSKVEKLEGEVADKVATIQQLESLQMQESKAFNAKLKESEESLRTKEIQRQRDLATHENDIRGLVLKSIASESCNAIIHTALLKCHRQEFDEYKKMHSVSKDQFQEMQQQWDVEKQSILKTLARERSELAQRYVVLESSRAI